MIFLYIYKRYVLPNFSSSELPKCSNLSIPTKPVMEWKCKEKKDSVPSLFGNVELIFSLLLGYRSECCNGCEESLGLFHFSLKCLCGKDQARTVASLFSDILFPFSHELIPA